MPGVLSLMVMIVYSRAVPMYNESQAGQDRPSSSDLVTELVPYNSRTVEQVSSSSAIHQGQSTEPRRRRHKKDKGIMQCYGRQKKEHYLKVPKNRNTSGQSLQDRFDVATLDFDSEEVRRFEEIRDSIRREDLVNRMMPFLPSDMDRRMALYVVQKHGNFKTHLALLSDSEEDQNDATQYLLAKYDEERLGM